MLVGSAFTYLLGQSASPAVQPPKAAVRPVTDEYFGQRVVDPYRWMEDEKSPELAVWMKGQSAYARAYLDNLPGYAGLLQRCREMRLGDVSVGSLWRSGDRYLYTKANKGDSVAKLYVRDGLSGTERLLYDPAKEPTNKSPGAISNIRLSGDGHLASFLVVTGGNDFGELRFIDLSTGKYLPDIIENTSWWTGSWAPDGRSILYQRFQKITGESKATDQFQKTAIHTHRLGAPASEDKPVFGYGVDSRIPIKANEFTAAFFVPGSDYAWAFINSGASPESDFYIAKALELQAGSPSWRKIASRSDQVGSIDFHGDDIYLLTFHNAPRYRVLKMSASHPNIQEAQVVVESSDAVVQQISSAKDGLYIGTLEGGTHRIYRLDYAANQKEEIPIPSSASADLIFNSLTQNGATFRVSAWTQAPAIYSWDSVTRKLVNTELQPPSRIDMSAFEAKTLFVSSHDGVKVPLVVIGKKGIPLSGENPVLLSGFGSYGIENLNPGFSPHLIPWLEKGGLAAIAGLRGGGEYGEEWHAAGVKDKKPNTWKDLIACAEYLIAQHYTTPPHLAVQGADAGAISTGNALAVRPDLFGAVIMRDAVIDTLRVENTAVGVFTEAEFGSVKTEPGFRSLLAMDAYHKLKNGVRYPAVLFVGGMQDKRVNFYFSAKMSARLQAATTSGKPILLDFSEDSGHEWTNTLEQAARSDADRFAFLFAQLTSPNESAQAR